MSRCVFGFLEFRLGYKKHDIYIDALIWIIMVKNNADGRVRTCTPRGNLISSQTP